MPTESLRRYLAALPESYPVASLGIVRAADVAAATAAAERRWPGAGVIPWHAVKPAQREAAMLRDEQISTELTP